MRFAVAAGLLAHALPAVAEHSVVSTTVEGSGNGLEALLRDHIPITSHQANGFRRNSKSAFFKNLKNVIYGKPCDPTSSDADIGVLSCGMNKYCSESSTSPLGGVCQVNRTDRTLEQPYHSTRSLEATGAVGYLYCDPRSDYFGILDCDCDGFDTSTSLGSFYCYYTGCFDSISNCCADTCGKVSLSYTSNAFSEMTLEICYIFSDPYSQTFCYGYGTTSGEDVCFASYNGDSCNSCTRETDCDLMDCSNVGLDTAACISDFRPPIIETCIDSCACFLCPENADGTVTNPDVLVGASSFTCSYLNDLAITGNLPGDVECTYFASLVHDLCCEAMPTASPQPSTMPTSSPTAAPTRLPTNSPTGMPNQHPSAAPTPGPSASPTALPTMKQSATPTSGPVTDPTLAATPIPTSVSTMGPSTEATAPPNIWSTSGPTSDVDGTTDSPTAEDPASTGCDLQIQISQCPDLLVAEAAAIPCDCMNKCIAFVGDSFEKCDAGTNITGSFSFVAGCTFDMAPEGTFDCDDGSNNADGGRSSTGGMLTSVAWTVSLVVLLLGDFIL
eukprot:Nitzschia sp. Nitz4//scaffold9_size221794//10295//11968//NITZ4_001312-RA/size221794-processed-gene-0.301-mRNA-1//-1//CDS//3329560899//4782//frame0